nr:immunoglobulin light chain junction region [Macaca mulatta]
DYYCCSYRRGYTWVF